MFESVYALPPAQRQRALADLQRQALSASVAEDALQEEEQAIRGPVHGPWPAASSQRAPAALPMGATALSMASAKPPAVRPATATTTAAPTSADPASAGMQPLSVGRPTASVASSALRAGDEEVLARVTERLAVRMRDELKAEMEAERRVQGATEARMERSLAEDLETNTCPICYELMVPPERAPMMLFKCGHTFCTLCLNKHLRQAGRSPRCPYCRAVIESSAPNLALQNLIADFVKRRSLWVGGGRPETAGNGPRSPGGRGAGSTAPPGSTGGGPGDGQVGHARDARVLEMRCRIMANELESRQQELEVAVSRQATVVAQVREAAAAVAEADERVRVANAALSVCKEQLQARETERAEAETAVAKSRQSCALIEGALRNLAVSLEKARLLESTEARVDGSASGDDAGGGSLADAGSAARAPGGAMSLTPPASTAAVRGAVHGMGTAAAADTGTRSPPALSNIGAAVGGASAMRRPMGR